MKTRRYILIISIMLLGIGIIANDIKKSNVSNIEKEDLLSYSKEYNVIEEKIVYNDMTLEQLSNHLEAFLNSDLSGYGYLYASYSLEKGVDPYLAVAISLHETGCTWECSNLVKKCNNVGGQKGGPSCKGGSYKSYDTLENGIKGFIDNLYINYISMGLTTPNEMNFKYAESKTWGQKVNSYIEKMKAAN